MSPEILALLLTANLAGSGGILLVVAVRSAARQWVGARAAYGLWLIPLATALATLLPARPADAISVTSAPILPAALTMIETVGEWVAPALPVEAVGSAGTVNVSFVLVLIWIAGVAAVFVMTLVQQQRSMRAFGAMTRGETGLRAAAAAGPAVIGLLRPRVVIPDDFEDRFSERERELILAHERAHLRAGDTRINALLALLTCVNWFNPMVHIAARLARVDQELACDAAVVERFPGERRIYAEALLKTQLASASPPLGCTWPPRSSNLLKERVMMLASKAPGRATRVVGALLIAIAGLGAGFTAWAVQPPKSSAPGIEAVEMTPAPAPQVVPQDARPDQDKPITSKQAQRGAQAPKALDQANPQLPPAPAPTIRIPDDAVITCNDWSGRHSQDPKVDWDNVDKNAPVVLTFKGRQGVVTLPNAAFPAGAYPASVANAEKGLSLRTGDRFVYQSMSPSVIDTITFDGLETGDLHAVWQRFRIDTDKPRAIALQGRCVRS
jgi:beta-lactamase regulating signal transducer with metallopeptidase domain